MSKHIQALKALNIIILACRIEKNMMHIDHFWVCYYHGIKKIGLFVYDKCRFVGIKLHTFRNLKCCICSKRVIPNQKDGVRRRISSPFASVGQVRLV